MIELLVIGLIVAVGVLVFLLVRQGSSRDDAVVGEMYERMIELAQAQQTLVGKVDAVGQQQLLSTNALTETLSASQKQLSVDMNARLETVQERMGSNLSESAKSTAKSLGELSQRLETIDKAQKNITDLSEQVVSLQHVLDDKHARGAFGEVQLIDLVRGVLPPSAYDFQVVLSN